MRECNAKILTENTVFANIKSTMSDIIEKNTRNYAKRQLTFFKKMPNLHWLRPTDPISAAKEIERYL